MKFCLDRREGDIAVCLCEEETAPRRQYEISVKDAPALAALAEGTLFEATLAEDGTLTDIVPDQDATDARRSSMRSRLHALANRKKSKGGN